MAFDPGHVWEASACRLCGTTRQRFDLGMSPGCFGAAEDPQVREEAFRHEATRFRMQRREYEWRVAKGIPVGGRGAVFSDG